jgi:hypothetical protein
MYNLKIADTETGECIGYAVDINAQGLRFTSSNDYKPEERLDLSIELPHELMGRRSVRVVGNVRWCGPDINPDLKAAGIQFSLIDPADNDALVALMTQFSFA